MKKEDLYVLLLKNKIYSKIDINETKVFEDDVVIKDENVNKNFKIVTDDMTKEDIIIALLAKQTLYINKIKNIMVGFTVLVIIYAAYLFLISISAFWVIVIFFFC